MVRYFENQTTKETARWDPPQARSNGSLLPGRAGVGHWHRLDTKKPGKYLDAEGKRCALSDSNSVLIPADQKNIDYSDCAYTTEMLDAENQKLIDLLDGKTENWLHDSTIEAIVIKETFIEIEFSYYRTGATTLAIKFQRTDGALEQKNIADFVGKEVYRLKLRKRELGNELEIFSSDNESLTVFYDGIEHTENSV